jgi:hypothetical protein
VDPILGAIVVPVSQAINPNSSSRVTPRDTITSINVSINSSIKGNSLGSSSSSTVRTVNQEETNIRGRTARQLAFLPQPLIRMVKQP